MLLSMSAYISFEHLEGSQAVRHSEGTLALGHSGLSKGTGAPWHLRHLGHSGTQGIQTHGRSDTWSLRALGHLDTQVTQALISKTLELKKGKRVIFLFVIHLISQEVTTFKIILDLIIFISIFVIESQRQQFLLYFL